MTRLRLCLLVLSLLASAARAELHAFEVDAPAAHAVDLAGEMTNWDQGKLPMSRGADGKWRLSVDLEAG